MTVVLHAGYSVAVFDDEGAVEGAGREGIYDVDARLLSRFAYALEGGGLQLVAAEQPAAHRWHARLIVPSPGRSPDIRGPALPQDVLELTIDRAVGHGLVDELTIVNRSAAAVQAVLCLTAEPDFADVQEVGGKRRQHGTTQGRHDGSELRWIYESQHEDRRLARGVSIEMTGAERDGSGTGLQRRLVLPAHGEARVRVTVASLVDGQWRRPEPEGQDGWLRRWNAARSHVEGSGSCGTVERAATDLGALRNDELFGGSDRAWFPNAGVPMFTGFFGRDTITAAWQAALLGPEMLRGALEVAARTQATADDPWRDEEPDKLVHEIRRGPLSMLDIIPQSAYYGTQTTAAMFVLALSEYWHWTADTAFLRRHLETALRTFDWADRYGDLDGDGFLEYRRRSPAGLKNQGWKDSDEAIRYPDGRVVDDPIATVEEQAFHFLALQRMAEILIAVGQPKRAGPFLTQARQLRSAWDRAFWLEQEQFYALALDPDKQAVASITSNPGHALGAGMLTRARAAAVADRLLAPDLFSGWGVRTLSADHPSYNPYAYHLGTVWPVEQATFALGFKRYGLDAHLDRLIEGLLSAADVLPGGRLPELLAGISRDADPMPVGYPDANVPQAWSASATVQALQVSLGLYPFAPLGVLALVRPRLPPSIPDVTLSNVRIGRARITLRFRRRSDGRADHEVLDRRGRLAVVELGAPNAPGVSPVDWLARLALRRLPERRVQAARIALGLGSAD
ncbi:MAG TPA: glycogen debranching N-terminal domain-containing protein [Candidatus Limnocylindrales bacterium]|nr:glycogen debranching N-terminal domain-containing protein [Candidatus Limnocylindrales bacterium]